MSDILKRAMEKIGPAFSAFRRQAVLADAYHEVYASPAGQLVIHDILKDAGLLVVAADPTDSRFYDGKRAVALHVVNRLRWSEAMLVELAKRTTEETLADTSDVP